MPLLKVAEIHAFLDRLTSNGFVSNYPTFKYGEHAASGFNLERDGLKLTVQTGHAKKDHFFVSYSGHIKKPDRHYDDAVGCADGFIECANHLREIRIKAGDIAQTLLDMFRVRGTDLTVVTKELRYAQLARFMLGERQMFALYMNRQNRSDEGLFIIRAPGLAQGIPDVIEDVSDEKDDEPCMVRTQHHKTSFCFSDAAGLLQGFKTLFDFPFERKIKRFGEHEIASLLPPEAFLDVVFENGLRAVAEKEVTTFRSANCETTAELLRGDDSTETLYAMFFKTAPAKL